MIIPYEQISPEVLRAIIEEFVTREGTEYGQQAYSLEQKVERVRQQLKQGTAKIVFNPEDESCSVMPCN